MRPLKNAMASPRLAFGGAEIELSFRVRDGRLATRQVRIVGVTARPTGDWVSPRAVGRHREATGHVVASRVSVR
jgi:hypothetical protein